MAGRPVKIRSAEDLDREIQSLQRLRTAVLMGRPTRSRSIKTIAASDKAIILIDGLAECLLELADAARSHKVVP
jgi:hypothetical protein